MYCWEFPLELVSHTVTFLLVKGEKALATPEVAVTWYSDPKISMLSFWLYDVFATNRLIWGAVAVAWMVKVSFGMDSANAKEDRKIRENRKKVVWRMTNEPFEDIKNYSWTRGVPGPKTEFNAF